MNAKHKKIVAILSSITGFILSTLGAIAIFYPNAFNLETNTIKQFDIEVSNEDDANKLDNFLKENYEKIVKLNIKVCAELLDNHSYIDDNKSKCPILRTDHRSPDIPSSSNSISIETYVADENGNIICDKSDKYEYGYGISFYFDQQTWLWHKDADCKNKTLQGIETMSGYFLVPEHSGLGQGWIAWMLKSIDDKDIKLKDY